MVRVEIVDTPLLPPGDPGAAAGRAGAVVEFHGIVRDREDGRPIRGIEYECHQEMARHQLRLIAERIASTHGLIDLTIIHRVGTVPAGEGSLYVRAVASHRGEAFAAAAELISRLKEDVPIWKHPLER
jgi:molybdopterin synthase catalytic subunit